MLFFCIACLVSVMALAGPHCVMVPSSQINCTLHLAAWNLLDASLFLAACDQVRRLLIPWGCPVSSWQPLRESIVIV